MKDLFKVIICGDREWNREKPIIRLLTELAEKHGQNDLLVIAGGAEGADIIAKMYAHQMNIHVAEVKALWPTRRQGAGPQRNQMMLRIGPHQVFGFHDHIEISKGTKGMINLAVKGKVPAYVYSGAGMSSGFKEIVLPIK